MLVRNEITLVTFNAQIYYIVAWADLLSLQDVILTVKCYGGQNDCGLWQ